MDTFQTSRHINATAAQIFAAIAAPERLALWWGPAGFTNTFEQFDFKPGGLWKFIMHAPGGTNYPNENRFLEIEANKKVVLEHIPVPRFRLTITLTESTEGAEQGTLLQWTQVLEDEDFAAKAAHIIEPANEQNLDRLTVEVLQHV